LSTQFILFFSFYFPVSLSGAELTVLQRKAIIQYNAEMTEFALENFERAIAINPDDDVSARYLGEIWLTKGQHRKALYYYELSLKNNEAQDDVHTRAGEIYDYTARYEKALPHFKRAAELNAKNIMARIGMARIASLKGNNTESEALFEEAFTIARDESSPLFEEALKARRAKKIRLAEYYCLKTLEINPAHTDAYYELSSIYRGEGNFAAAIAQLERLKYYQPNVELLYHHIANIYYANRVLRTRKLDYDAAIVNINRAIELNPDNLRNWELLEDLYRLSGDDINQLKTRNKIEELINSGAF